MGPQWDFTVDVARIRFWNFEIVAADDLSEAERTDQRYIENMSVITLIT